MINTVPSSSISFAQVRVRTRDAELAERASAEAFGVGAQGIEEREIDGAIELLVYAERARVGAVCDALAATGIGPGEVEPVPDEDWSEAWRQQLDAIEISNRLVVRPSFVEFALAPGQREVVIDPGQAFGTGSHESTRLALEWVSVLAPALGRVDRVLDVGIGSGVLALAALGLSPARALGFDLDPLAADAVRANARVNGAGGRLCCFTGGIEALAPSTRFALVLANLLRSEVEPILPAIASHVAPLGSVVLSGLLESEASRVVGLAAPAGLVEAGRRRRTDASGVPWISLWMVPRT